jgi:L-lactate dehydrogenase
MTSASGIKNALLSEVAPAVKDSENKVTIVGVGQVGMACTFSVLAQVLGRY